MADQPSAAPEPMDVHFGGVELLEDRTSRIAGGRAGRRLGASLPGALAGAFLVTAIAFGAGFRPSLAPFGAGHAGGDAAADGLAGGDPDEGGVLLGHTGDGDAWAPDREKDVESVPGSETVKPDGEGEVDEPKPVIEPVSEPEAMDIALALDGGKVVVKWSICDPDGFRYYKVIRSTDESVSWPLGTGDTLVAAFESPARTSMVDGTVAAGTTYFYRVFAVLSFDGELVTVCKSDVASIATPAPEPTPKPEPKPEPKPTAGGFDLSVWIGEAGHPVMEWGSCGDVSFTKFKVVRSLDGTVSWPTGANDTLFTATGPDGHKAWDNDSPTGVKLFYRVFCVRSTESGYVSVAASEVVGIFVPALEPVPVPDPVVLGFEIEVTGEGAVLHWEACGSDGFAYYKVVRSMTTEDPSYFPWTNGTELIAVIENSGVISFGDANVASGQTWYYRVQSIGYLNGQKVLLGQTPAIAVTIP